MKLFFLACSIFTALITAPQEAHAQPYPKWLAIGDSITQHGPKAELKWLGEPRGMAASEKSKDYVHLLLAELKARDAANASDLKIVGRIGKLSAGTVEQMTGVLEELKSWGADLVTIQLGENDNLKEIGAAGFEERYRMLVDALHSASKRPTIVCTGVWLPGAGVDPSDPTRYKPDSDAAIKDAIIGKICQEKGLKFVRIASAAARKETSGTGETNGVKWHPNDAGMRAYADAILGAIYPSK